MKIKEIERKFLVNDADLREIDLTLVDKEIIYLDSSVLPSIDNPNPLISDENLKKSELTVLKNTVDKVTKFYYTLRTGNRSIERIELTTEIDEQTFETISENFGIAKLRKKRFVFRYSGMKYELDLFSDKELMILEVMLKKPTQLFVLPPFISIAKEITNDPAYDGKNMASKLSITKKKETLDDEL